jgi:hypothetical protein
MMATDVPQRRKGRDGGRHEAGDRPTLPALLVTLQPSEINLIWLCKSLGLRDVGCAEMLGSENIGRTLGSNYLVRRDSFLMPSSRAHRGPQSGTISRDQL